MTCTSPTIWVIEKTVHTRNQDNYLVDQTELEVDEGYFPTKEAAQLRAEELNGPSHTDYLAQIESSRKAHQVLIRSTRHYNKEAAAIRAAGMPKADRRMPEPYVPITFSDFMTGRWTYTTFGVEALVPAIIDEG